MKLSSWHPAILAWLGSKVQVDSWYLDSPEVGKTNAFVPPLRNVNYTAEDPRTVRGYGIQDIILLRRYPKTTAYKDLPIAAMEGLHSSLSYYLAVEYAGIADLTRLEVLTVEDPVHLVEQGDRSGDWFLQLHVAFSLTWYAEPEEPLTTSTLIRGIDLGIYTQRLDESASTLDYTVLLGQ